MPHSPDRSVPGRIEIERCSNMLHLRLMVSTLDVRRSIRAQACLTVCCLFVYLEVLQHWALVLRNYCAMADRTGRLPPSWRSGCWRCGQENCTVHSPAGTSGGLAAPPTPKQVPSQYCLRAPSPSPFGGGVGGPMEHRFAEFDFV